MRKRKEGGGRPGRLPPGYFFRPIMAAMAPITTRARTATMIVVVSRPAVTRGSTVPTRCSAITVVLPVPSEWPVAVTVATTRNCVRGPTSAVNVVVNLPWAPGAVIAVLSVPVPSVVPLATWLPAIQNDTAAPDTGTPSASVTFAIAVVVVPALTEVGTIVSTAARDPADVTCTVWYVQKLFTPPGMFTQPAKDPRTVASSALK